MKTLLLHFCLAGIAVAHTLTEQKLIDQSHRQAETSKEKAYQLIETTKIPRDGKACSSCQDKGFLTQQMREIKAKKQGSEKLLIFVSSSMPQESLKALFHQAQEVGATLIFRGLIEESFMKTKAFFEALQINGEINPPLFETYGITQVPTFVIREGDNYDSVQGNISLQEALILIRDKGDLKGQAKALLTTRKEARG